MLCALQMGCEEWVQAGMRGASSVGTGRGRKAPPPRSFRAPPAPSQPPAMVVCVKGDLGDKAPRRKGVTQAGWSRKMEASSPRQAAQPQLWLTGVNWGAPGGAFGVIGSLEEGGRNWGC